ncbi:unnamed protein product [Brassicogethes aeneus]|uniref:MOG interacting and ectopic P-granules protein 1 n=1 Tax=Brassicogethes aeneus TaxID=1431903 RepID=A0A9P0ATU9_BRAAE|nr:unnamed protein product [Brassicogethes aeneus]
MAEEVEMGEVDEMHSKDEGAILNGDISNNVDMESSDSQKEKKISSVTEAMEVEEENKPEAVAKENTNTEINGVDVNNTNSEKGDDEEEEEEKKDDDCVLDESVDKDEVEKDIESNPTGDDTNDDNDEGVNSEEDNDISEKDEDTAKKKLEELSKNNLIEISDDVHEIDDNEDESSQASSIPSKTSEGNSMSNEPIDLNDSGGEDDGDVMIVESVPKENGTSDKLTFKKTTEIIELDTPEKKETRKISVSPRRSSRNLNKSKSYVESIKEVPQSSDESDIEEVTPQDPLAVSDAISIERIPMNKTKKSSTIVVKDTKKLVEIAAKSNNTSGKKEPTLVIIDTNSILSGRGPVPINKSSTISTSAYSAVLPVALPAQGMYPANMRATITPIPVNSNSNQVKASPAVQTPLLPTLTDDMFVVEAPSFIVPYVYEKPPVKDFKDFVLEYKKKVEQMLREEEEEERKREKEERKKEKGDDKGEDSKDVEDIKSEPDGKKKKKGDDDTEYNIDEEKDVDSEEEGKGLNKANKPYSYFTSPLGKFFVDIGFNLVQEYVQSDLLRQQKRKRDREGGQNKETERTIHSLIKNLEYSKENNEPFKIKMRKCEFCNFKTESALAMSYHLETPHMKNFVYRCNFCTYEVRSPHDILFHMEAEHAVRGHLERAPAFHQCSNCPFEDNQKGKLSRHLVACAKKFKPERNLDPPIDWEPPAKIPRVPKVRQQGLNATAAAYQAMSKNSQYQFLSKMQLQSTQQALQRGRGRPPTITNAKPQQTLRPSGMLFKQQGMSGGSVLVPTNYQLSGNQVYQQQSQNKKPVHQPSISITPLPRGSATSTPGNVSAKPGDSSSKNSFVICEICDGYIKDLEQLRNHMQWIHKIKIHPKMIYNRPPLNCQKCQFRFFTDQGLERHLLGSHGLVTSSMQDAANKSKDSGRCPVCGRVYQWKLLNHVARDHNMTLKPAHLSYKCTVCTATFGMYKQFENHVYSAHSVVAKRVMDKKTASPSAQNKTEMKPLKINDEITIIPQPPKSSNGAAKEGSPSSTGSNASRNSTPSTSKNDDAPTPSTSRAERLARRNANGDD